MKHEEALGQIYAMRESIANKGWTPNQDQELALALADMLDEAKVDTERLDFMQKRMTGASDSERYLPFRIYWGQTKNIRKAIDEARSNHEPF